MSKLKQYSKQLRKNQTFMERKLWFQLRAKRFHGYKFYRQYVISPYIVDFINRELKLIVELDGGQHMELLEDDLSRTKYLEKQGYKIIRFWNNQLTNNFEEVMLSILTELRKREAKHR